MKLDNLDLLKETTTLSKEWINNTNAKPKKVALWVCKNGLSVAGIYWENSTQGVWDDENAVSMTNLILDLPI